MEIEYESEGLMVTHQTAQGLFKIGVIDAARMREFDEMCLPASKPEARKPARSAQSGGAKAAVPFYAAPPPVLP